MHRAGGPYNLESGGAERNLQLEGVVEVGGEESNRRPGAGDDSGEGAILFAQLDDLGEGRLQVQCWRLEIVVQHLGQHVRVAGA